MVKGEICIPNTNRVILCVDIDSLLPCKLKRSIANVGCKQGRRQGGANR